MAKTLKGYLPTSRRDMERWNEFLRGKRGSTDVLEDQNLLSTQFFHEPRFATRAAYMDYATDPAVNRYRRYLKDVLGGGVYQEKMMDVSREAAGRSSKAARINAQDSMAGMGAGVDMPGIESYVTGKIDMALAGELGEANRQAAMSDLQARVAAGETLDRMAQTRHAYAMDIANMGAASAPFNQKQQKKNPWKSMGMQALSTALGVGATAATGGAMGAIMPGMTAAQGAMSAMGWGNLAFHPEYDPSLFGAPGTPAAPATTSAGATARPYAPWEIVDTQDARWSDRDRPPEF